MKEISDRQWFWTRATSIRRQRVNHCATEAEAWVISLDIYFLIVHLFTTSDKEPANIAGSNPSMQHLKAFRNALPILGVAIWQTLGCGKSANLQTANCIIWVIYICTGGADWSLLFIVVIGDHCFTCGSTFLRMHQETYNYYDLLLQY